MAYGMINSMDVKIDQSGRIVVPKPLRDRLGLKPDMVLEVQEQADGLFLRALTPHPTMVHVDGVLGAPGNGSGQCGLGARARGRAR